MKIFGEKVAFTDYANFESHLTKNHLPVTVNFKSFCDWKSDSLNEEFKGNDFLSQKIYLDYSKFESSVTSSPPWRNG